MRHDGRPNDQLREISITRAFTAAPAGSVLWRQSNTIVLCTASVSQELPPWFKESRPGGWITAEYVMLPASTPQRKAWPKTGHTDSRGTEIQRLIGRALRGVIDLSKIGPHTIAVDCQVLQADGGTRTAAICGAYVALCDALAKLPTQMPAARAEPIMGMGEENLPAPIPARYDAKYYGPAAAMAQPLAAVSVGIIDGEIRLDLDYVDDSRAEVDMNFAMTGDGKFIELQATAEAQGGFDRRQLEAMLDLAQAGCRQIMRRQAESLGRTV